MKNTTCERSKKCAFASICYRSHGHVWLDISRWRWRQLPSGVVWTKIQVHDDVIALRFPWPKSWTINIEISWFLRRIFPLFLCFDDIFVGPSMFRVWSQIHSVWLVICVYHQRCWWYLCQIVWSVTIHSCIRHDHKNRTSFLTVDEKLPRGEKKSHLRLRSVFIYFLLSFFCFARSRIKTYSVQFYWLSIETYSVFLSISRAYTDTCCMIFHHRVNSNGFSLMFLHFHFIWIDIKIKKWQSYLKRHEHLFLTSISNENIIKWDPNTRQTMHSKYEKSNSKEDTIGIDRK